MEGKWPEVDVEDGLDLLPFTENSLATFTKRVLEGLFLLEKQSLRLSVHFCGDAAMRDLHEKWLGDSSSTDVMSFPLEGGPVVAAQGELLVCIDHARAQAASYGNAFEHELALYLVHGALHLMGYDDHDPVELVRMKASEARVLKQLGLAVEGRH